MGTGSVFAAGASQMHKGIPHLHSITPAADWFCVVGSGFGCFSVSMSNLETLSVMESTPSTFSDLCPNKIYDNWINIPPKEARFS